MADLSSQQRLSAVLAADVVGYTRLMEEDTEGTVSAWQSVRDEVINPVVSDHSGRIVKLTGDGFLAEFPTVHQAVRCGIAMQDGFAESSLVFRIGINLGDIIDDGQDIHGEGVNIAARIEALADPGGICISASVHEQVRNRIDVVYDDLGEKEVKNVSAPVRVFAIRLDNLVTAHASVGKAIADKPSIAVLPFNNLSGDPEQEYFSDGISEDIITALSRIRSFFVIARNTTFTYKGQAVDVQAIAKKLGVRYVLEGSVRKAGNRVRITAQLIDGDTGNHIWADKYDREMEDIFEVQDEITQTVVGAIEPELDHAERERALLKAPENLDAWEYYQKGLWHFYRFTREDTDKAAEMFKKSIEFNPRFSSAHAGMSCIHFSNVFMNYADDRERELMETFDTARHSVECDRKDPFAHWVLGRAHLLHCENKRAISEFKSAIELNSSFAHGYYMLGWTFMLTGQYEGAIQNLKKAMSLSPHDPISFAMMMCTSVANAFLGELDLAVEWTERGICQPNAHEHIYANAAFIGALAGRDDVLKTGMDYLSRNNPNYTCADFLRTFPFEIKSDFEVVLNSLRKAGLPEG